MLLFTSYLGKDLKCPNYNIKNFKIKIYKMYYNHLYFKVIYVLQFRGNNWVLNTYIKLNLLYQK